MGFYPSGHPHIFLENGTQTVKMQFDTFPQKIQKQDYFLYQCNRKNPVSMLRHQTGKTEKRKESNQL